MSRSRWLTLVAPDAGAALMRLTGPRAISRLERAAGRGLLRAAWSRRALDVSLRPWQRGLLNALGLAESSGGSAAFTAAGLGLDVSDSGYWLHAQPAHFVAGLDRVLFAALPSDAAVTAQEFSALTSTFQRHFPVEGFRLHAIANGWFVSASRALAICTSTPEAAASNELQDAMPHGTDAASLRRLMTELQMLLHEHPVNDIRSSQGIPPVNALWLWGGSAVPVAARETQLPPAFGDNAFAQGIYRLHGSQLRPLSDAVSLMAGAGERAIAIVPTDSFDHLESEWIDPLLQGLGRGRLARLDLILDEWHLDVPKAALRKFWRRPRPFSEWSAAA